MPRDALVLKIPRELCHQKCARNVSGLLRNRPQISFRVTNLLTKGAYHLLELTGPKELVLIRVNGNFKAGPWDYSHDPVNPRSLRGIHERANVNNIADLAMKRFHIPLTLLRDFLSTEEEDTLFLNDLEEELAFFQLLVFFLGANLRK